MTEVNVTDYLSERRGKNEAERQQSSTGFIISVAVAILSWILVVCVPAAARNIMSVIAIIPSIAAVVYSSDGKKFGNIEGIIRSGQEGEDVLKASLHECLSDEYVAFFGVPIEGRGDIDCVIVAPAAIYAIESKHHNGSIRQVDSDLFQVRHGRGGRIYPGNLKRPVAQLTGCIHGLKNMLKEQKVRAWVEGAIVFTNSDVDLGPVSLKNIRVATVDNVSELFKTRPAHPLSPGDRKVVLRHLHGLKIQSKTRGVAENNLQQ